MQQLYKLFFFSYILMTMGQVYADTALVHRPDARIFINEMVKQHNFDKKQLFAILSEAKFQPKIIAAMDAPYEKKSWDVYKSLFLTPERLKAGLAFWQSNKKTLDKAEKQFGVPASIIVAIIGVETLYGKRQGDYRVLDALTTLAFYYPKRSAFFTKELKEFLLLCREHKVSANKYLGSYAGAMGKPQFMPSSYRFYAVDFSGNGRPDLMHEDKDVIGSVANYFHKHGWIQNEDVAEPAIIRGDAYKKLAVNSKIPDYSFSRLLESGVRPTVMENHPKKAGLIELITQQGLEYWFAYPNFYVITRYNTSPQYALVVMLLSQQLTTQRVTQHTV